jgi:hypothetical protein
MAGLIHLVGPKWRVGEPLRCWDRLVGMGVLTADDWVWPDAVGTGGDLVALFEPADQHDRLEMDYLLAAQPWRRVVVVDLPRPAATALQVQVIPTGHWAVADQIPAPHLIPMPSLDAAIGTLGLLP